MKIMKNFFSLAVLLTTSISSFAAGGSVGTLHTGTSTSVATTIGTEFNGLNLYLDSSRPEQANITASVHVNNQTGDLSGSFQVVTCDDLGACGNPINTRWTAKLSTQFPYSIPVNWQPGIKTASGRPLGCAKLYIWLDPQFVVSNQPAPVYNNVRIDCTGQ